MRHEELEEIFCWKIGTELNAFKYGILQKEKEDIYSAAYQIDSMINLYELLIEMCAAMEEEILTAAITVPGLLHSLYDRWLKYTDSYMEEMKGCVNKELETFRKNHQTERMEQTA